MHVCLYAARVLAGSAEQSQSINKISSIFLFIYSQSKNIKTMVNVAVRIAR